MGGGRRLTGPSRHRRRNHGRSHTPSPRTDGGNGDSDRGDKQRAEIWRQEEAGSQNKSGGSRGMRTG